MGNSVNAEWAAIYITLIGLAGTALNVWIALTIRASVLKMQLWATDKFVSKDDMPNYLSPIKASIQMISSAKRMHDFDPNHQHPQHQ
jgi:hypothetical protein